jgi:hypothetical protein
MSRAIFGVLNDTLEVEDLVLEVADAVLILAVSPVLLALGVSGLEDALLEGT